MIYYLLTLRCHKCPRLQAAKGKSQSNQQVNGEGVPLEELRTGNTFPAGALQKDYWEAKRGIAIGHGLKTHRERRSHHE